MTPSPADSPTPRVAVVDDDPTMVQIAARVVDGAGFTPVRFDSGSSARAAFEENPFVADVVLTDLLQEREVRPVGSNVPRTTGSRSSASKCPRSGSALRTSPCSPAIS